MCGILFASRKDKMPVVKSLLKRYEKQKARGTEGYGYIAIKDGKVGRIGRSKTYLGIEKQIEDEKSSEILFHHRTPTSTPNLPEMTHPIVVKNKSLKNNYYVIHNGVLSNDDYLKDEHELLGFKYTTEMSETIVVKTRKGKDETTVHSFNDSEALAIDLALYFEGKQKIIKSVGSIAFICLETDKKNNVLKIHYGSNSGSPITEEENGDLFFIKSIGGGKPLLPDKLVTIDYKTKDKVINDVDIGKAHATGFATDGYGDVGYAPVNRVTHNNIGVEDALERIFNKQNPNTARDIIIAKNRKDFPAKLETPEIDDPFPNTQLPLIGEGISTEVSEEQFERMTEEYYTVGGSLEELKDELYQVEFDVDEAKIELNGGAKSSERIIVCQETIANGAKRAKQIHEEIEELTERFIA